MVATQLPIRPRANVHPTRFRVGGARRNHILVQHTSEGGEGPDSEQSLTNFIQSPRSPSNAASYNSWNDVDSIRPGVDPSNTAFHCGGLNSAYGHCFTGKAGQTIADWNDSLSAPSIELGARYQAQLIALSNGDLTWFRWLTDEQLATRTVPGFSTHNQIRKVFGGTTHTDPGPNFPYSRFMDIAIAEFHLILDTPIPPPIVPAPTPPIEEDDMTWKHPIVRQDPGNGQVWRTDGKVRYHIPTWLGVRQEAYELGLLTDQEAWGVGGPKIEDHQLDDRVVTKVGSLDGYGHAL